MGATIPAMGSSVFPAAPGTQPRICKSAAILPPRRASRRESCRFLDHLLGLREPLKRLLGLPRPPSGERCVDLPAQLLLRHLGCRPAVAAKVKAQPAADVGGRRAHASTIGQRAPAVTAICFEFRSGGGDRRRPAEFRSLALPATPCPSRRLTSGRGAPPCLFRSSDRRGG